MWGGGHCAVLAGKPLPQLADAYGARTRAPLTLSLSPLCGARGRFAPDYAPEGTCWAIHWRSWLPVMAPLWRASSRPLRNRMSVGMARI